MNDKEFEFKSMAESLTEMNELWKFDPRPHPNLDARIAVMVEHLRLGGHFRHKMKDSEREYLERYFHGKMHMAISMDREDRKNKTQDP